MLEILMEDFKRVYDFVDLCVYMTSGSSMEHMMGVIESP